MKKHRFSTSKILVSLLLGVVMLFFLFTKVSLKETFSAISEIPFVFLLIAVIVGGVMQAGWIARWKLIVDKFGTVKFLKLVPIFLAGSLINQLTPGSKSGGQPLRAYYLSKINKKSFSSNLATALFDFLAGAFASTTLIIFAVVYLLLKFPASGYSWIFVLLFASFLVVVIPIVLLHSLEKKSKFSIAVLRTLYLIPFIRKRFHSFQQFERNSFHWVIDFYNANIVFLKDWRLVFLQVCIEFWNYFLDFFKTYLLFLAIGEHVSFVVVAVIGIISQVAGFVFFTPGGIGIIESSSVGLYYLFGVNPEIAAAIAVINLLIKYFYEFGIGYLSFLYLQK
ncbi:flippase-like domain-containing protein [Candidatus Woesearchaeota archaeon]|nr:flippase-like domain-containing protein [Candidatus Woesearchaeota archaeon]